MPLAFVTLAMTLCLLAGCGRDDAEDTAGGDPPAAGVGDTSSQFAPIPELLDEKPSLAADFYLRSLHLEDYDAARSRVMGRCLDRWDGSAERQRLVQLGILGESTAAADAPNLENIRGRAEELDRERRLFWFERGDVEYETYWVQDPADGKWRLDSCP